MLRFPPSFLERRKTTYRARSRFGSASDRVFHHARPSGILAAVLLALLVDCGKDAQGDQKVGNQQLNFGSAEGTGGARSGDVGAFNDTSLIPPTLRHSWVLISLLRPLTLTDGAWAIQ